MDPNVRVSTLPLVLAMLGACASGGGGGGSTPAPGPTETPLVSFAAVAPSQTVVMEGTSATLTGTTDGTVATTVDAGQFGNATLKFSYDSDRQLSAISVNTPEASLTFDRNAPGRTAKCSGQGACRAENDAGFVVAVDPSVAGWNYQTFGVWAVEAGPNTFKLGAVSGGSPTSGSSLPTTGSATFVGASSGHYIDAAGALYGIGAGMRADVNFGTRNIQFSTSNTTRNGAQDLGLNLSGTLSYAPGVNAFSGSVQTANGQLSGRSEGRFFGPAAEEIGGVYSLQGTGVSRMVGGFGGKRP